MAASYFAVPAAEALSEVVEHLGSSTDRRARIEDLRRASGLYVEAIIEGLVLGLVREPGAAASTTASLLESLSGVVKGIANGLIRSTLSDPSEEELAHLEAFLRTRVLRVRWDRPERAGVAFRLEDDVHARLRSRFAASHAGRATEARSEYGAAMIAFVDQALHAYFLEPFALMKLGRLLRAAVDVGHATIARGSHAAARHATNHDDEAQLLELTKFLESRVVEVVA